MESDHSSEKIELKEKKRQNHKKEIAIALILSLIVGVPGIDVSQFYKLWNAVSGQTVVSEKLTEPAVAEAAVRTYTFRNKKLRSEHFKKHKADFTYMTTAEYVKGANRVIRSRKTLHKKETEDGDDIYYLEKTNEIVFVSRDGYIRTYFKPVDGKEYFERQ